MASSKLYQYEVCPFCWKARVALALKGVDFEKIEVHPLKKKEIAFSADYKKVPILVDASGVQVNDSNAIMEHVDSAYEGVKLFAAADTDERKKQEKWLNWSEGFVKGIPPLIYDTLPNALKAFDYITKEGKFSWFQKRTIKYSGALVMKMVAKKSKERQNITDPKQHIEDLVSEWEEALAGNEFMGGSTPDASDAAVFGITLSTKGLPAWKLFKGHPGYFSWMKRMSEKSNIPLS
ncbi:hypothetical protein GW915_05735 [bacterium]|nr:hypothetical protein [bacterium]